MRKYADEMLGKTTLIFCKGELVAYYTIYNDVLRKEYLKIHKSFSKLSEYKVSSVPSITIGRLAVDKKWQSKGIGRILIQRISMYALDQSRQLGIRLLIVQAKKNAIPFYEKLGFDYVADTASEKKRFKTRGTRTMFFDIKLLRYLLSDY